MARLEDLTRDAVVKGVLPDTPVTVVDVKWYGSAVHCEQIDSLPVRSTRLCS
jgi:hypothetical protein